MTTEQPTQQQKNIIQNPLLRAFDRARRASDATDRDGYHSASEEIVANLPNVISHTVETDDSGFYLNVRFHFKNKRHRV